MNERDEWKERVEELEEECLELKKFAYVERMMYKLNSVD